MRLRMNKAVPISHIPNATIPDAVAEIGNIKLEADGTLSYAMHFYATEQDAIDQNQPISTALYNMTIPNLENQILADAKNKPLFDVSTDL